MSTSRSKFSSYHLLIESYQVVVILINRLVKRRKERSSIRDVGI